MAVHIGAKPDSGFDDPIGMLTDCHRRIEQFLNILATVAERVAGRSLTGEEAAAVQAALQYFRTGGVCHTADEESSLFPRLRAGADSGSRSKLDALEADHETAAELHEAAERLYSEWMQQRRTWFRTRKRTPCSDGAAQGALSRAHRCRRVRCVSASCEGSGSCDDCLDRAGIPRAKGVAFTCSSIFFCLCGRRHGLGVYPDHGCAGSQSSPAPPCRFSSPFPRESERSPAGPAKPKDRASHTVSQCHAST